MTPTKAELQYEVDLDGEAIMLVREHLKRAGVEATFVDDAAALAANRLVVAEELLGHAADGASIQKAARKYLGRPERKTRETPSL